MSKAKLGSGKRFKSLTAKIEGEGKSKDRAKAIAASIGMKKYGKTKMMKMAHKGKMRQSK